MLVAKPSFYAEKKLATKKGPLVFRIIYSFYQGPSSTLLRAISQSYVDMQAIVGSELSQNVNNDCSDLFLSSNTFEARINVVNTNSAHDQNPFSKSSSRALL